MKKNTKHSIKKTSKFLTRLQSSWRYVMAFAAGAAALFGILSYIHPNISVTPLMAIDASRPLSMQFLVTNNGYLTMHDVKYACAIEKIKGRVTFGSYGGPPGVNQNSPRFVAPQHESGKSLAPNQSDTVSIDFALFKKADPVEMADIGIVASFRLSLIPWRQERLYHFVTQKCSDGKLYWFPKPPDD
ncbi:MAG: hypothetical protein NTV89_03780 [Proteobacteria bacterium]|nr:hypothetical protein [Pseudomonadota bacterium]